MAAPPHPPPLAQALRLLSDEARQQVEAHPWGHLLAGRRELVPLQLTLPLDPRDLEHAAREAAQALSEAVQAVLVHRTTFRPGRVFCLRCRSADCAHAALTDHRQVFTGYGATGLPRFQDLGQWLLQRHDPRVDELYQTPPRLLTVVSPGAELTAELLPAYQDTERGFQLHGQVAAGWYTVADGDGHPQPLALTVQVLSSQPAGQGRRFGLNVLARGPGGESLETVCDRLGEIPWAAAVRWGQSVLSQIEGGQRRLPGPQLQRRIDGLLLALGRRLDKQQRGRERRTHHAEQRHGETDRPTRMALADAREAARAQVLFDVRRGTLVVLGERGRAHVFNLEGKLVTSVRYSPAAIARRRKSELWRAATDEEVATLEKHLGSLPAASTLAG